MITFNTDIQQHYLQHQYAKEPTLVTEPEGWRTSDKKITRGKNTGEMIEKNAKDIAFIGNGKEYILNADSAYGIKCKIQYTIVTVNPKDDGERFVDTYFIDMSTIKSENGKLKCKVDEGGLAKLLKAKKSEKVELDRNTSLFNQAITELETERLRIEGRNIFLVSELSENVDNEVKTDIFTYGGYRTNKIPFPFQVVNNSHLGLVQSPSIINSGGQNTNIQFSAGDQFYLHNERDRTLNILLEGSFKIEQTWIKRPHNNVYRKLVLYVLENGSDYNIKQEVILWNDPSPKSYIKRNIEFSENINVDIKINESICLMFETGGNFSETSWLFDYEGGYRNTFSECEITTIIEEDSSFPSTQTKCLTLKNAINRSVEIITGKNDRFYSEYLTSGEFKDLVIYPHLWVRGFDEKDKVKPSISFKDLTESASIVLGGSTMIEKLGFKERLRFEKIDFFYNPNILIRLPNVVEDLKREYANDFIFGRYEVGYEKGGDDYQEATGIGEYNGYSEFTNQLEKDNGWVKKSKVRADSSAVEFARRKHKTLGAAGQEDTQYDSEWAFDDTKQGITAIREQRKWQDDFIEIPKGIYSPETATNLKLTPIQIRNRHSFFITGGLGQYTNDKLMFTNSNCNSDLELKRLNDLYTKENENTTVKNIGKAKFKPYWWTFTHQVDFEIQKNLRGKTIVNGKEIYNFYGVIEYKASSTEYRYGYLFEVKENKGEFKILEAII